MMVMEMVKNGNSVSVWLNHMGIAIPVVAVSITPSYDLAFAFKTDANGLPISTTVRYISSYQSW